MSGGVEPRPEGPVEAYIEPDTGPIQVPPVVRLDQAAELDLLRAEVERLRRDRDRPGGATRVNQVGPWRTERTDEAQPMRTAATGDRRRAAADVVLGLKALGAVGLAVVGVVALAVVLTVLYGLFRLAGRFAAWAADGSALLGGIALVVAAVAIVGTGLWLFLRLTDRRRADR